MNTQQRLDPSMELWERSNEEFNPGGNTMIAAELLWGAYAQLSLARSRTQMLAGIEPRSVPQHRNQLARLTGFGTMGFGLGSR